MSNIEQQTIDKLFRDLIRVYSTSATSMVGLDSIQTAIKELVCEDSDLFKEIRKYHNHIDILINNAGIASLNHSLLTTITVRNVVIEGWIYGRACKNSPGRY